MSKYARAIGLAVLLLVALVAIGRAQTTFVRPKNQPPVVIMGSDVGFRVDHFDGDVPVGELVVKRNGEWVPVQFSATLKRMK